MNDLKMKAANGQEGPEGIAIIIDETRPGKAFTELSYVAIQM